MGTATEFSSRRVPFRYVTRDASREFHRDCSRGRVKRARCSLRITIKIPRECSIGGKPWLQGGRGAGEASRRTGHEPAHLFALSLCPPLVLPPRFTRRHRPWTRVRARGGRERLAEGTVGNAPREKVGEGGSSVRDIPSEPGIFLAGFFVCVPSGGGSSERGKRGAARVRGREESEKNTREVARGRSVPSSRCWPGRVHGHILGTRNTATRHPRRARISRGSRVRDRACGGRLVHGGSWWEIPKGEARRTKAALSSGGTRKQRRRPSSPPPPPTPCVVVAERERSPPPREYPRYRRSRARYTSPRAERVSRNHRSLPSPVSPVSRIARQRRDEKRTDATGAQTRSNFPLVRHLEHRYPWRARSSRPARQIYRVYVIEDNRVPRVTRLATLTTGGCEFASLRVTTTTTTSTTTTENGTRRSLEAAAGLVKTDGYPARSGGTVRRGLLGNWKGKGYTPGCSPRNWRKRYGKHLN